MAVDAPPAAVHRALRQTEVFSRTARALGGRLQVAGEPADVRRPLRVGDVLRVGRPGRPAPTPTLLRVLVAAPVPELAVLTGPATGGRIGFTVRQDADGPGSTVTVSFPGSRSPRTARRARAAAQVLLGITTLIAREPLVVVAGVVIDGDRVMAARRAVPSPRAGGWEFPGGKVEPGESEADALARELREELAVTVRVGERIGPEVDLGGLAVLRCRVAALREGTPTPIPGEHDEIRWLTAAELTTVPWLPADRDVLPAVRSRLVDGPTRGRKGSDDHADNAG